MSDAIAWIVCVTTICATLTAICNSYFARERKMAKLKFDHEAEKVNKYMLLNDEQAKAMQANTCDCRANCSYPSICRVGNRR